MVGNGVRSVICVFRDSGASQSYMFADVVPLSDESSCGSCDVAQGMDTSFTQLHTRLANMLSGHVTIDCVSSLPKAKYGFHYLFTLMCAATRFPGAIPICATMARAVVGALTMFFIYLDISPMSGRLISEHLVSCF